MPYNMNIYVDGSCRGNGQPGATGAAAAVFQPKYGKHTWFTRVLPQYPTPTNQRAEIMAIILALEEALKKYDELDGYPRLYTRIYSDSKYAIGCMNEWINKWMQNDWTNSAGYEVANRDLIEKASDLDDRVSDLGPVEYIWIPRGENEDADRYCNRALDRQERGYRNMDDHGREAYNMDDSD
jgi:ribonuclease HI